jgi:hypothetical protein
MLFQSKFLILILIVCFAGSSLSVASAKARNDAKNVPVSYEEIYEQAIINCHNSSSPDKDIVKSLIEVEKSYDVPPRLRGMLLAAACSESGFNPNAKGDWRTRVKNGRKIRVNKALGLFQMWKWWEKSYQIDRTSIKPAAYAFMKHITRQLKKIKCKFRTPHRKWVAAWVTAIRSPKKGGRCHERPLHLKILKKWHKNIHVNKKNSEK